MPFPSSPSNGQNYVVGNRTYTYSSSLNAWAVQNPSGYEELNAPAVFVYTSGATFTKPDGAKVVHVRCVGGGGGGGGGGHTVTYGGGSAGGGGGLSEAYFLAQSITSTVTVTVGAGGAGGSGGGGATGQPGSNGSTGGTSSFGSYLQAAGGAGGGGASTTVAVADRKGAGGNGMYVGNTSGDAIYAGGGAGGYGSDLSGPSWTNGLSSAAWNCADTSTAGAAGDSSTLYTVGGGGAGGNHATTANGQNGGAGGAYGGGGGGGGECTDAGVNIDIRFGGTGGTGGAGIVVVTVWFG